MPIHQYRMINLISAALDYQGALESFTQLVRNDIDIILRLPPGSPEQIAELINLKSKAEPVGLLKEPQISYATIANEHIHFRAFGSRNRAEALRQARRRGRLANPAPIPQEFARDGSPANSAPLSIRPANYMKRPSRAEPTTEFAESMMQEDIARDAGMSRAAASPLSFDLVNTPTVDAETRASLIAEAEEATLIAERAKALADKIAAERAANAIPEGVPVQSRTRNEGMY